MPLCEGFTHNSIVIGDGTFEDSFAFYVILFSLSEFRLKKTSRTINNDKKVSSIDPNLSPNRSKIDDGAFSPVFLFHVSTKHPAEVLERFPAKLSIEKENRSTLLNATT